MKPRTKTVCRWLLLFSGALFLLVLLFLLEEHIRGRVQLKRYLQQMQARGEKLSIQQLTPAAVSPHENGAGPFLAAALTPGHVVPDNLPSSMRFAAPNAAIAMPHRPAWTLLKRMEVSPNTNDVFALWRTNAGPETPRIRGTNVPMLVTSEDLADDIRSASNGLNRIRASLQYGQFDFGVNYAAGLSSLLPHLPRMKSPANWLRAASLSALYETNLAASLENLLALASLATITTNEPLSISQLVRLGIFHIGVSATWEALQVDGWTDSQLEQLQRAYGNFEILESMTRALEMERAMSADLFDQVDRDAVTFLKNSGILETDLDLVMPRLPESYDEAFAPTESLIKNIRPAFNRFIYVPVWKFAWKNHDRLRLLHYWQGVIERARLQTASLGKAAQSQPASKETFSDWFLAAKQDDYRDSDPYDNARYLLSSLLAGSGESILRQAVRGQATRELVVTDLALRRFELARGKKPDSLDELIPRFLDAIPIDPWDGKPLRYKPHTNGLFVLYSVGENGRDEGGDGSPRTKGSRPTYINGRDLVWPRAATAAEVQQLIEAEEKRFRRTRAP